MGEQPNLANVHDAKGDNAGSVDILGPFQEFTEPITGFDPVGFGFFHLILGTRTVFQFQFRDFEAAFGNHCFLPQQRALHEGNPVGIPDIKPLGIAKRSGGFVCFHHRRQIAFKKHHCFGNR